MRRAIAALFLLAVSTTTLVADGGGSDGYNEILAVVNGKAVTYQQVVGATNMQAQINSWRVIQKIPPSVSDAEIEAALVHQQLEDFVLQKLLDDEAEKVQLRVTDTQLRSVISFEKARSGIADEDTKAWANFCKERFGLTPNEYRDRRRAEIRRNEVLRFMSGQYGALPPQYPLEVYFGLSVSPLDLRREFDATRDQWRIARDIDYRVLKLLYPQDISIEAKKKLYEATGEGDSSVHARVLKGESLEAASEGLRKLISDLGLPGVSLQLSERTTAKDDTTLDANTYQMAISVPARGGVSDISAARETDEQGATYEGFTFVQLFSRVDGDRRNFSDPKVQEALADKIYSRLAQANAVKVQAELLRRAAIVPEHLFDR